MVDTTIVAGTAGTDLVDSVRVESPRQSACGEQCRQSSGAGRSSRFGRPPTGRAIGGQPFHTAHRVRQPLAGVVVPEDKVEVTVRLTPERAVGGLITPVRLLRSSAPSSHSNSIRELSKSTAKKWPYPKPLRRRSRETRRMPPILIHRVLITAVQQVSSQGISTEEEEETNRLEDAPEDDLLVTLALSPVDAERVVFTAEFGFLDLASERETVSTHRPTSRPETACSTGSPSSERHHRRQPQRRHRGPAKGPLCRTTDRATGLVAQLALSRVSRRRDRRRPARHRRARSRRRRRRHG